MRREPFYTIKYKRLCVRSRERTEAILGRCPRAKIAADSVRKARWRIWAHKREHRNEMITFIAQLDRLFNSQEQDSEIGEDRL